jgi:iron complex outermembrane receptor protein
LLALLAAVPAALGADADADGTASSTPVPPPPPPPEIVEEVTVTATRAQARRDAISFSVIDREEIAALDHAQDTAMLLAELPGGYAYSDAGNGVGYSYFSLRGFDQRRIAVTVNGVPLNTPEAQQVYFVDYAGLAGSLDGLQVKRGPGMTQYGTPAVGGSVNMQTAHLSRAGQGQLLLGVGAFGTDRVALEYGGPIGTEWAWLARVSRITSEGYRDDAWTRHAMAFLGVEHFGERSMTRIHLYGGPEDLQLAYLGVPKEYLDGAVTGDAAEDRKVNLLKPGETDHYFQPRLEVINDWQVRPGLALSNTAYLVGGGGYYRQYSPVFVAATAYDPAGFPTATVDVDGAWRKRQIAERQLGWIPRVAWQHGNGELVAGLELRAYRGHHRGTVYEGEVAGAPLADDLPLYDYVNTKTTATVYVREAWSATPSLVVNGELAAAFHRYAMKDDAIRGLSYEAGYAFLLPRLGVNWNLSGAWNLYGSVSTAASEPRTRDIWDQQDPFVRPETLFADRLSLTSYADPYARPERLTSYEVGAGYTRGATGFGVNLYRMEFRDELVYGAGIDDDGNPQTVNAGRTVHQGIELQGAFRLPGRIDVSGWGTYSRDEIVDLVVRGDGVRVDQSGNRIALFPVWQGRLVAGRSFGPVLVQLGGRWVGTIYTDNSQNERKDPALRGAPGYVDKLVEPWAVADLRLAWDLTKYAPKGVRALALEGRIDNLFDRQYVTMGYSYPDPTFTAFYTEFYPAAVRGWWLGVSAGF